MKRLSRQLLITVTIAILATIAGAQTTAFTYQGNLVVGGVPANGNFDFQFILFAVPTGGSSIGLGVGVSNVAVTNGAFTTLVNFGNQFPGAERWLEIRVRPAGQGGFTTLAPRQVITSSPYAVKSLNTELLGGFQASQFVLTTDSRLSDARAPLPNSASYIQNRTTQQAASSFNISGSGAIGGPLNVVDSSTFQKALSIGTTLSVGETASVGGNLTVAGTLTVNSPATATGPINTASHFNIGGNFALGRSRLDLFNTDVTPRGFTFEVLNNPEFLVVKNELGSTLLTVASDGKVGIGDNTPTEATLEVGGSAQISGSLALGQLGGSVGEHLCKGVGETVKACSATGTSSPANSRIDDLEVIVRRQQAEIEKQRVEINELKRIVCSIATAPNTCNNKTNLSLTKATTGVTEIRAPGN
jgi:hypothetical protein